MSKPLHSPINEPKISATKIESGINSSRPLLTSATTIEVMTITPPTERSTLRPTYHGLPNCDDAQLCRLPEQNCQCLLVKEIWSYETGNDQQNQQSHIDPVGRK